MSLLRRSCALAVFVLHFLVFPCSVAHGQIPDLQPPSPPVSAAVIDGCRPPMPDILVRANLHSHTGLSDGTIVNIPNLARSTIKWTFKFQTKPYPDNPAPIAGVLDHARNVAKLQCWAVTDHIALEKTQNGGNPPTCLDLTKWEKLGEKCGQADGRFCSIRGFEWSSEAYPKDNKDKPQHWSHMNVIGSSAYPPTSVLTISDLYRWIEENCNTGVYDVGKPVCQFNHPAGPKYAWQDLRFDSRVDDCFALCEVGSGYYGVQKIADRLGKLLPALYKKIEKVDTGYVRSENQYITLLRNGWHVGVSNNQDSHPYITLGKTKLYPANHTGVWVYSNDAAGIMEALRERHTFATEDHDFRLKVIAENDYLMGSRDVPLPQGRKLRLRIIAEEKDGDDIGRVTVWYKQIGTPGSLGQWVKELRGEPMADGTGRCIDLTVHVPALPNAWYLVKIKQSDGNRIYSSPIWTAAR